MFVAGGSEKVEAKQSKSDKVEPEVGFEHPIYNKPISFSATKAR
jgi:hypothetical protein